MGEWQYFIGTLMFGLGFFLIGYGLGRSVVSNRLNKREDQ